MSSAPKTLQEAIQHFTSYENCKEFMVALRWPTGVICPRCGSAHVTYLERARVWKCYAKHPQPTFTLKTGTVFEDSPLGLDKWLPAVWQIVNCRNGVSSWELHRSLGVTQKSCWFMLQRIRLAMQDNLTSGKLAGEIEVDETFIGGKARNMHKSRKLRAGIKGPSGPTVGNKTIVHGLLDRNNKKVRLEIIPDRSKPVMQGRVKEHVEKGATVMTDAVLAYYGLHEDYTHEVIDHAVAYVRGNVHTNGLENFWSLLKRALGGTYVSVEPFHLFRYVDEQAFRYNHRKHADGTLMQDAERFTTAIKQIVGKRLTYAELTGKEGA